MLIQKEFFDWSDKGFEECNSLVLGLCPGSVTTRLFALCNTGYIYEMVPDLLQ